MDLGSLIILASEAGGHETSKTPFYVAGLVLAGWAVIVSVIGIMRASFPGNAAATGAVYLISAVLVGATLVTAITTS